MHFLFMLAESVPNAEETTLHYLQSSGKSSPCFKASKKIRHTLATEDKRVNVELPGQMLYSRAQNNIFA
jgi:hypothetical protein